MTENEETTRETPGGDQETPPETAPGPTPPPTPPVPKAERDWALFCHISALCGIFFPILLHIVPPLLLWLLRREEYPFVEDQGKEAVNFGISLSIYMAVSIFLMVVFIGFLLFPALLLFGAIISIVATVKASEGTYFRYPLSIRFIR